MDENQTNPEAKSTLFVPNDRTQGVIEPAKPAVTKEPAEPKVDHIAEIAVLANSLTTASPSGAESIRDQILQRCADIKDPKAYDARMAAQKKAHDEAEAASKKIREADKAKAKAA